MGRSFQRWQQVLDNGPRRDQHAAARDSRCPPTLLNKLITEPWRETSLRTSALSNPSCPHTTLARIAMDDSDDDRDCAIRNPSLAAAVLAKLATDKSPPVRAAVASNPNAPPELLTRLAVDGHQGTRYHAAEHPNAPAELLARLAVGDPDPVVAAAAASNPSCPEKLLARLAVRYGPRDDQDRHVHRMARAVASNPASRPETLRALAAYGGDDIYRNPYLQDLASNPSTPPDVLMMCRSSSVGYAGVVARRGDCPPELLAAIADPGEDYPEDAATAAAGHPNCPPETLAAVLAAGSVSSFAVQFAAFTNPSCPPTLRKRAASDAFFCSRWDAAARRRNSAADEQGKASDRKRSKTHRGEQLWQPPHEKPVHDADMALAIIHTAILDLDLRARYPHIVDRARFKAKVAADMPAGTRSEYHPETDAITVRAGSPPRIVLHELAHRIVEEDPRHSDRPLPADHGPEFTAVMLDLVEVSYGIEQRAALRARYAKSGAPLDRWDAPLNNSDSGQLADPVRLRHRFKISYLSAPARCGKRIGRPRRRRRCRHLVASGSHQCAAGHPVRRRHLR